MQAKLQQEIDAWLAYDPDPHTQQEIRDLLKEAHFAELARRFNPRLSFGTAGLRGLTGAGPARMNRLLVQQIAMGVAHSLGHTAADIKDNTKRNSVVLAYDGRRDSQLFAHAAARVLAACGWHVDLFAEMTPTPLAAFAVLYLGATAGIVITASHNPADYNGIKIYGADGALILPPQERAIETAAQTFLQQPMMLESLEALQAQGLVTLLDDTIERAYLAQYLQSSWQGSSSSPTQAISSRVVSIAYSPLQGVGARLAEKALHQAGFSQVHTVLSQREPDAAFSTLQSPNPEDVQALTQVLALAKKQQTMLACVNDPDADRFRVAVRNRSGDYDVLSGDEIGVLLADNQLRQAQSLGRQVSVGTTVVSSRMLKQLAQIYGAHYFETLTGFKWLMHAAHTCIAEGLPCVFAYEEALGFWLGHWVHDKDGIAAMVAFAQLVDRCAQLGMHVLDRLEILQRQCGIYVTKQRTWCVKDEKMQQAWDHWRAQMHIQIGDIPIHSQENLRFAQGARAADSDVLIYELAGNARLVMRPSGTEPKIKCYYEWVMQIAPEQTYQSAKKAAHAALDAWVTAHQRSFCIS